MLDFSGTLGDGMAVGKTNNSPGTANSQVVGMLPNTEWAASSR